MLYNKAICVKTYASHNATPQGQYKFLLYHIATSKWFMLTTCTDKFKVYTVSLVGPLKPYLS